MRSGLLLAASVCLSAAAFGWLQRSTPDLVDRDSYYHARYAQLFPQRLFSREFPWAQESLWKDSFSDKELLYHVWLAPFCRGEDVRRGAKVATWLLDGVLLCVMGWLLLRNGVRAPWAWVLLVPALGNHFLFRMLEVRSHVLSVMLLLLGVHFLLQRRGKALAAVGFVYSWSYAASYLLAAFALIDAVARTIEERRIVWRGFACATVGVALGLLIHPYFPNDLSLWWVQNVQVLSAAWRSGRDPLLRLGAEFYPVTTREFLTTATLVFLFFTGGFVGALFGGGRITLRSRLLLSYLLGGFLLYCVSAKFVEYFAPLSLLAAASVASDLWPERSVVWKRVLLLELACVLGGLLLWKSLHDAHKAVKNLPSPDLDGVARWTREHVPEGETIAHLGWEEFDELFYFDPTHHYLVGLDPTFMYVRNPAHLKMLEDVRAGRRALDPKAFYEVFGTRYLLLGKEYEERANDALLVPVYEDAGGAVYLLHE